MEKDKERQSIRTGVKLLFCLLVSGFVFLIACQAVEPEKRAYPQVIGIDWQKEEQRYTVWMHMASLAEDTGQRKQSAETQPGNELYFTGSDGAQIHTAYEATREQYLDIGHVKAVIFGTSLRENRERLREVLTGMESESSLGNSLCIFTTDSLSELSQAVEEQGSLCAVVTVWSVWNSYRFAEKQREKIYVLDNGKSLMLALSQDLSQNRPAEAREHVRRFHEMFFTLSPEKSAIEHNVKRALLLADKSVYHYYSDFAEKGYYNRIIAGNINQVLKVDSVVCDFNAYPYRAVTYATQKIIRQSNVTERSLVTTCRLLNASRSDDNPNGFTIEGFTIIENKDLQTIKR